MYRGRFAPTPSGPLHLGSLVAAVGSYLDAKAHHGEWLVRIEDVDKPRAVPGAANTILAQLEAHGLEWDGPVLFQGQRDLTYQSRLNQLQEAKLLYQCDCSRQAIRARSSHYDGYCRNRQPRTAPYALRFVNKNPVTEFTDRAHGLVTDNAPSVREDFVLKRRDGLYAYQLAVVVDDIEQGITDIVRGSDLITPSFWQLTLWQEFTGTQPQMMHLPLIMNNDGRKLSKQNHAPPVDSSQASNNVFSALKYLDIHPEPELRHGPITDLLQQALQSWRKKWHKTGR
ncbi:tRNA glutamyl-Q(34) synthetase GluQRS [Idiomarina sp. HP20-50]|uniref:tRNA glutamyl-Q(34) synthetase GluQRS n=1 Tax=Idiomarina sp. HP20-50 TaxID=3070813 RepID=UPI00294AA9CC|nr:tRNA glutamyl-Q(34) synthetase GluQRS [Idiomarina sp. HP20-50]MDV6315561.1 tRNA glutamyl-Q(34) synthetase GluQRS [Idiomarina sp. HP20-50]